MKTLYIREGCAYKSNYIPPRNGRFEENIKIKVRTLEKTQVPFIMHYFDEFIVTMGLYQFCSSNGIQYEIPLDDWNKYVTVGWFRRKI
jgi:hypothetical protein